MLNNEQKVKECDPSEPDTAQLGFMVVISFGTKKSIAHFYAVQSIIARQKSIQLLPLVYEVCRKLPKDEMYNIISQMKRAGLSVFNNLAEGASRKTKPGKKRFFEISRSSVVEIDNSLTAIVVLNYLTKEDLTSINAALVELFRLICGLIDPNEK